MKQLLLVVALVGCSKSPDPAVHAVGTYIGRGSVVTGADNCTYAGGPGVFQRDDPSSSPWTPRKGPRFVSATGQIKQACGDTTTTYVAAEPTGATITGASKVKVGETSGFLHANLVANGKAIGGEANIEWQLMKDCEGIAEFAPVLGSQDTGGPERSRRVLGLRKGACTVIATLTTGSSLHPEFKTQGFQAATLIRVD